MFKPVLFILACLALCFLPASGQENNIVEREYWIDQQIDAKQNLAASPAEIDISGLAVGLHSLTMRVKDNNGLWSSPVTKYFIKTVESSAATQIVAREYWIDGKMAQRQPLAASVATVDITDLAVGLHSLSVRVKDDKGLWSSPLTKFFFVSDLSSAPTITRCRYWIDDDEENAVIGSLSDNIGVYEIDVNALALGEHTLSWMVGDSRGVWSKVYTEDFTLAEVGAVGTDTPATDDAWYDLSGHRLATPPTQKGVYIHNGRKVLIIK